MPNCRPWFASTRSDRHNITRGEYPSILSNMDLSGTVCTCQAITACERAGQSVLDSGGDPNEALRLYRRAASIEEMLRTAQVEAAEPLATLGRTPSWSSSSLHRRLLQTLWCDSWARRYKGFLPIPATREVMSLLMSICSQPSSFVRPYICL